jgi:hypothetical protein
MNKFIKGMYKDSERVDQIEGTYRDALNANLYVSKGAVVNETGNVIAYTNRIPEWTDIIGQCNLEDGRIVVFYKRVKKTGVTSTSAIGVLNPREQSFKELYINDDLNFQADHTIEAMEKISSTKDVLIYFTDNYINRQVDEATGISYVAENNPPRVFNLSKQERHVDATEGDVEVLYDENRFYNVDKLDLFLNTGNIPQFLDVSIEEGGGVVSGTYHLALAYVDEDGNETNYMTTSNAVYLVTAPEDAIPTETIIGDPQGSQSNKSISWEVQIPSNLNYTHIQPTVIQRFGGINQESSEFAYKLDKVEITDDAIITVTYTGLETAASTSVASTIIDSVRYETAKSITQLDNQMYISNLEARGDIGYQRFANNIKLDAVVETVEDFDPRYFDVLSINRGNSNFLSTNASTSYELSTSLKDYYKVQSNELQALSDTQKAFFSSKVRKGYKDVKLSYKMKSFRRSEVYAFYISFVLKDGTETYAYHIPGRSQRVINYIVGGSSITINENDPISRYNLTASSTGDYLFNNLFNVVETAKSYPDAKLHQVIDTQLLAWEASIGQDERTTSYWENDNELYPDTDDFSIFGVDSNGKPVDTQTNIKQHNVRHHKMPTNKISTYGFVANTAYVDSWNGFTDFDPNIIDINTGVDTTDQTLTLKEDINILGVKLSNIKIPRFILEQVQGYKIYYAKRQQANKTIIGQSVVVPSVFIGNMVPTMSKTKATAGPFSRAFQMVGAPINDEDFLINVKKASSSNGYTALYKAFSVFKFHDFNLLKNKHTLTGASHIDVQYVLPMQVYAGGPHARERSETIDGSPFEFFDNIPWVGTDIGNTVDPNYSGNGTPPTNVRITAFNTSVLLAAGYASPNALQSSNNFELAKIGVQTSLVISNLNSIFTIHPKSITYLPGHTQLEVGSGTSFHGVKYLLNFGGESAIAIGLTSGLPALRGYKQSNLATILANGNTYKWNENGVYLDTGNVNNKNVLTQLSTYRTGAPVLYLTNLCAIKSDVYKSFDEQSLVWTGYYKDLSEVDVESGGDRDNNYYDGADSDNIFGGDTYITRYGFRSTNLRYGWCRFNQDISDGVDDIPFQGTHTGSLQVATSGTQSNYADANNWIAGNNNPNASIYYFFCEADDLIGYRYNADQTQGVNEDNGRFFDYANASATLFNSPIKDNTKSDNLLYMNNYSLNQDIRVAVPLPKVRTDINSFPTRTIRSNNDEGSISDKYRKYLGLEYKDIPKNKGDIWKIFTMNGLLFMHTERSLFTTKGKQEINLGNSGAAYVGGGNLFEQEPQEIVISAEGYGGTDAQFSSLTTRYGQFFVNRKDRKVYLFGDQIEEISAAGLELWFIQNLPYQVEELGLDLDKVTNADAPTKWFGFTAAYDSAYKRIILTKKERRLINPEGLSVNSIQNGEFISQAYNDFDDDNLYEDAGWTISYYPELKSWGSRHSYTPKLYAYNSNAFFSFIIELDKGYIWKHDNDSFPCNFYDEQFNFEFEFIDNQSPAQSKIFSAVKYHADVVSPSPTYPHQLHKHTSPGFTQFYVYNTNQISGEKDINYLSNSRLVDRIWWINEFRDMSATTSLTNNSLVTGIINVQGTYTTGVVNNLDAIPMFEEEGVINTSYLNTNKSWFDQRRLVDNYLAIRLISDNSENNLIYLYSAGTKNRPSFR